MLGLPGCQFSLVQAVYNTGKPGIHPCLSAVTHSAVVLVLINGGPLSINWEAQHVPAIVEAFYPV